ncbi:hypothetical protein Q1695_004237 [Nippostrongylus brasiliensis]|nr:hypothetical protein Q1695_004237 [Nippostrongylus brasiliensis]
MLDVPLILRLVMYFIGNLLTTISIYILLKHAGLHNNFRVSIFLLIMFGFARAFFTYCITFTPFITDANTNALLQVHFVAAFVYCICGFAIASLLLSVERFIAITKPKIYERNSDNVAVPLLIFAAVIAVTFGVGYMANVYSNNQIPLITVCTVAGFLSLILATVVWKRAKTLWNNRNSSLGQRFQIAEMTRTSPIYLFISVDEAICITIMSIIGFLMLDRDNTDVIATSDVLVHVIDVVGAWRIIFINLALIYYSFSLKKTRLTVLTHMTKTQHQTTADHFKELKEMWK